MDVKHGSATTLARLSSAAVSCCTVQGARIPKCEIQRTAAVWRTTKLVQNPRYPPAPFSFWPLQSQNCPGCAIQITQRVNRQITSATIILVPVAIVQDGLSPPAIPV